MTRERLDHVFTLPAIGEPVSAELLNDVATLIFFGALACDVPAERLCLGHLVGRVTRPRIYTPEAHPHRRRSDREARL